MIRALDPDFAYLCALCQVRNGEEVLVCIIKNPVVRNSIGTPIDSARNQRAIRHSIEISSEMMAHSGLSI
jgi:hypothetical protein